MITFLVFVAILGVLIIAHEWGHFFAAKKLGVKVERFSLGFGPKLLKKQKGDTEYTLSLIPLGGYVKLSGDTQEECHGAPDEYCGQKPWKRAAIVGSGPVVNYLLGILFFWMIFFVGYPTLTTKVGGLVDSFGAKAAGIQVGDHIRAIDGKPITYWEDLQDIVREKKDSSVVVLTLTRNNQTIRVPVKIKAEVFNDVMGSAHSIGLLGVQPSDEFIKVRHGFIQSLGLSLGKTWGFTVITYQAFGAMLAGKLSMRDSVTGPLGIYYITSKAAAIGVTAVLHLVAILSISLAIFNLLPLPVLDGGHLLFLAIEKIRGRALNVKVERVVTQVGFTLIVSLAVMATYNDVVRLFGDKIAKLFVR